MVIEVVLCKIQFVETWMKRVEEGNRGRRIRLRGRENDRKGKSWREEMQNDTKSNLLGEDEKLKTDRS